MLLTPRPHWSLRLAAPGLALALGLGSSVPRARAAANWYWDNSVNEWNAGFPGSNHWLVSFGGAQNSDLPNGNWNSLYIQGGQTAFSAATYLGTSGYWSPQPGVMGTTPVVTGGELAWNDGVCDSVGAPSVSGTGRITVTNGIFGGVHSGWAASVGQGGLFVQSGGTLSRPVSVNGTPTQAPTGSVARFEGGVNPGSTINHGVVYQAGGTVTAVNNPAYGGRTGVGISNPGVVTIGTRQHWDNTQAYYYLGNAAGSTGTIGGSKVTVGGRANWGDAYLPGTTMKAQLRGYGTVTAATLDNNRQVVADGYGAERDLDLSGVGTIDNSYFNGVKPNLVNDAFRSADGSDGWYAVNRGRLRLPTLAVAAGDSTRNWGEPDSDATPDLINSLQLRFHGVDGGPLAISLLAADRHWLAPTVATGAVGFYAFDPGGGFEFGGGSVDLAFRYNDLLAGAGENTLQLFKTDANNVWQPLPFTLDTVSNLITASGVTAFSYFGIGQSVTGFVLPEPGTVLLAGAAAALALRRRRR